MSKNLKVTSINMTEGNPYKIILMFSLPLLFGNILQQLYNLVDSVVVGNYVGEKALAAVGAGFPIIFMIVSLFAGIGMGATVMISQFFGAEDRKSISDTINTMYTAMMIGSIPLSLIGIFVTRPMLILMKVPDDGTLDMAVTYMIIAFIGLIGVIGYNTNAGILQGLGDSKTSLIFLAIATVINIILDVLFVVGFKWGIAGVAFATIIAQFCSWIFGIYYINKHFDYFKINIFNFKFKKQLFLRAMKLGIPAAIQQILFSVGTMFMQTLVNSYGSAFMAGFNGANKIDTFAFMPIQSFSVAMTTYAGQNIGAGKIDRVKKGTTAGLIISLSTCVIMCILIYPLSGFMMRMFGDSSAMIDAGITYLHQVLPLYPFLAMVFIYSCTLRGTGETLMPLLASVISLWLARIPAAYLLGHFFGQNYIYYSYGIGWFIGAVLLFVYYKTGKWQRHCVIKDSKTD